MLDLDAGIDGDGELEPKALAQARYEAEARSARSGTTTQANYPGFTGSGFEDFGGQGSWIEWNSVRAQVAGEHELSFRYANGSSTARQAAIVVNGKAAGNVGFASTSRWSNWRSTSFKVALRSGNNTIRVLANTSNGGPNLDHVVVSGPSSSSDGCVGATLGVGAQLVRGQALCSPNGTYALTLRSDGNLVLSAGSQITWQSGVLGGTRLVLQRGGNLVIYEGSSARWSSKTAGKSGATLSLQDDGVAALRHQGKVIWSVGGRDLCPTNPAKTEPGECGCDKAEGTCSNGGTGIGALKIVWFSVGSADSSLIVFPNGKIMMVDSATPARFADRVLPFLQRHGIDHLDYYAETHPHPDHVGGKALLQSKGLIDSTTEVWDWNTHEYEDSFTLEGTKWFIYNARDRDFHGTDANDNSLSYRIEYNGFVYTSTGDEGVRSMNRFLADHPSLVRAHVRKVAHHAWGPFSPSFLIATDPALMVISSVSDVRYESAFKRDFLGAVNTLKKNGKRLREYVITEEVGHVILHASGANAWSYDFCPNVTSCAVTSFP